MNMVAFLRRKKVLLPAVATTALVFLLGGCQVSDATGKKSNTDKIEKVSITEENVYDVYVKDTSYRLSKYEPSEGNLLGAYILGDKYVKGDISSFEEKVGTPHEIYADIMRQGDLFPLQWVLECYSQGKTPMVILYPSEGYNIFDMDAIEETAEEFGILDIPIFLQLYPNPLSYQCEAEYYIENFRRIREIFQKAAPNVAFVWSIDSSNVKDSIAFYPGDDWVDWIGLNIYSLLEGESTNLWSNVDYFYYTFQSSKPLMISQLGISHYSTGEHKYETESAARLIEEFYRRTEADYPRIKAIVYMDYNGAEYAPKDAVRNDFTVTGEKSILKSYQDAVAANVSAAFQNSKSVPQYFKSPFKAFVIDGKIYINRYTLDYDLKNKIQGKETFIHGKEYIELERGNISVDHDKKEIILARGQ